MKYRLVYTQRAIRDLDELDASVKQRIGDYRVVFDLEGDQIVVLRMGHRREIYRR